jgi:hypothetical protein
MKSVVAVTGREGVVSAATAEAILAATIRALIRTEAVEEALSACKPIIASSTIQVIATVPAKEEIGASVASDEIVAGAPRTASEATAGENLRASACD